jgi:crotonobetainyl-CoA:carnitine CoA-transferase CaiB-like acyl-CoA transferase
MYDFEGVLSDLHLKAVNFFQEVEHPSEGTIRQMAVPAKWSRTPAVPDRLAPRQGEDATEILQEAGFTNEEIEALQRSNAIGTQARSTAGA